MIAENQIRHSYVTSTAATLVDRATPDSFLKESLKTAKNENPSLFSKNSVFSLSKISNDNTQSLFIKDTETAA